MRELGPAIALLRSSARYLIALSADCAGSLAPGANRITLRLVKPGATLSAAAGFVAAGAGSTLATLGWATCLGGATGLGAGLAASWGVGVEGGRAKPG